jgi:hypothetical protein
MNRKRFHLGAIQATQDSETGQDRLLPEGTPCTGHKFLVRDLRMISLEEALFAVQSGWLLQYRPSGYIGRLMALGTQGPHCHTAMAQRICEEDVDVLAMHLKGGCRTTLEREARLYNGKIDMFFPRYDLFPHFSGEGAADYMRYLVDSRYGLGGVLKLAMQRTPLLWRLFANEHDDRMPSGAAQPFCSHAYSAAARLGGGQDPVPRKADFQVTPNDLTYSLMFGYYGTIYSF